jgi:hypothetical protein
LLLLGMLFLAAICVPICVIVNVVGYHQATAECRHWSQAIGRPSKEVRYTWWSYDCLTPNPAVPGTWIPTDQVWVVNH